MVNLNVLTYTGNRESLILRDGRPVSVSGDICNGSMVRQLFDEYRPEAIMNFAVMSAVRLTSRAS